MNEKQNPERSRLRQNAAPTTSTRSQGLVPASWCCGGLLAAVLVALQILLAIPAEAQAPPEFPEIDAGTRAAIIDSITTALNEVYVFPDKAAEMESHVRALLADGSYDEIASPVAFANRLTEDLRSICHDRHLRVGVEPPPPPQSEGDDQGPEQFRERARRSNYQFEKIEILPGNIGYLKFNAFMGAEVAGATAVAAMNFLANVDALIVDLTENGGGSPSMIQLITSYFFEEPTHLNSFYIRKTDEMKQFWTQAHVAGPRLVDVPIWVLTSSYTFSGAEEFTYNLKNLERATIIGETTGGGAHPVQGHYFDFDAFHVTMSLPFGRAVNPITGTNWEGTGIEPHIQVPADQALATAQLEALQRLQEGQDDEDMLYQLAWAQKGLEVQLNPISLSAAELEMYAGTFGPRRIWLEDGTLWYQREDRPRFKLVPMGEDMFMLEDLAYFRLRFEKDADGKATRIVGLYDNGYQDVSERSDG